MIETKNGQEICYRVTDPALAETRKLLASLGCIVFNDDVPFWKLPKLHAWKAISSNRSKRIIYQAVVDEILRFKTQFGINAAKNPFGFGTRRLQKHMKGCCLFLTCGFSIIVLTPHSNTVIELELPEDSFSLPEGVDLSQINTVSASKLTQSARIRACFRHEYGHLLYEPKIDELIKDTFRDVAPVDQRRNAVIKAIINNVSYYAAVSKRELAAEVFAKYTDEDYQPGSMAPEFEKIAQVMIENSTELFANRNEQFNQSIKPILQSAATAH